MKTYSVRDMHVEDIQQFVVHLENDKLRVETSLRVLRDELNRRLDEIVNAEEQRVRERAG